MGNSNNIKVGRTNKIINSPPLVPRPAFKRQARRRLLSNALAARRE